MRPFRKHAKHSAGPPRHGVARVLSKRGYCSRAQAGELIRAGRVKLNGKVVLDPETPADVERARIEVDGAEVRQEQRVYVMLNKPRGLVTTASDERDRETVYACLKQAGLPWLSPVGRLDQASEGLLLFTNDTAWADRLLDPRSHVAKTYHVQIDQLPDESLIQKLLAGIATEEGEILGARAVRVLRHGTRNGWLEIVLSEGRNRHIRRMLAALGIEVLRLVRVAIGKLELGNLGKGQLRRLTPEEIRQLGGQ